MKIKLLTVLMAALFSQILYLQLMHRLVMERRSKRRQLCLVVILLNGSRQFRVARKSAVTGATATTANSTGTRSAAGARPTTTGTAPTAANYCTASCTHAQIPPPQQQVTHVNPQTLEELPAPVLQQIQPITPGQVRSARSAMEDMSAAAKTSPLTPIPRISSQTVSLSAGASIPQVRYFQTRQRQ
ncbi:DotH/IcmK family type IV secretion protein [Klebsiella michiganensis]|uniref:DotH/IcmK family type IV secretion protein n=1 Tax=Klebsiella michiganensis TaxID=1134687 RepID=UPI000B00B197|nr:DotH/IcmK family type IV secretion protein [Klebsiella michiganensis]